MRTTGAVTVQGCIRLPWPLDTINSPWTGNFAGLSDTAYGWRLDFGNLSVGNPLAEPGDSHSELRCPLPHRAQSPGLGQPDNQPRTGPPWKRRRGPTTPAAGRHAELLLPHRLSL